jgi:hypothetical protein
MTIPLIYKNLCIAIKNGDLESIKQLKGVDIRSYNDMAFTLSLKYNKLDIAKYFIQNDADIHWNNESRLKAAMFYNRIEILKYILEQDLEIFLLNDSILKYAIESGNLRIVKILIDYGFDVNAYRCLRHAFLANQIGIVKVLVENGASTKNINETLISAILLGRTTIAKYLVFNGADNINEAIWYAKVTKEYEILYYLKRKRTFRQKIIGIINNFGF